MRLKQKTREVKKDGKVQYTHTTTERDETGVYKVWWYYDVRVAMVRQSDRGEEVQVKNNM